MERDIWWTSGIIAVVSAPRTGDRWPLLDSSHRRACGFYPGDGRGEDRRDGPLDVTGTDGRKSSTTAVAGRFSSKRCWYKTRSTLGDLHFGSQR
ncbi:hypothetical protein PC119_g13171 [Phytophthora cactorum]|uniref:Uncharacterized protein n=1 Tax=Phytophthora cactorum TaxID=29920 RepID=A0A8T0YNX2_9STRA|nr:hypothetical protein PC111_g19650 [Phytophthora cactorum]KAG2831326.1 hypothetical protein PC112_g7340 [Phytophthora cactorum]KAG2846973.1 hypothetical protein PC113_g17872 [Phytophthora cactorum]KAG2888702.1 hypothetical protein PC115_g19960 [Phytophthora cactorum]KAG3011614.1 hypothetical protein PC119_g13171 [Phytophthora cactorum]